MSDKVDIGKVKKLNPEVLCVYIADPHCGSSVGLYPADKVIDTDDGGQLKASWEQEILWRFVKYTIAKISKLKQENSSLIVRVIFAGDLVEGYHHGSTQLMTSSEVTMENIGYEVAGIFVDLADEFLIIRGTEAHVGASAAMEERIAVRLNADFPKKIICDKAHRKTWWVYERAVNGILMNVTHHGSVGRQFTTRLNPLLTKMRETIIDRHGKGQRTPHLMIGAHAHICADTKDYSSVMRVLQLPCLKYTDSFGHSVVPSKSPDLGIWMSYHKSDGNYEVLKYDFSDWLTKNKLEL